MVLFSSVSLDNFIFFLSSVPSHTQHRQFLFQEKSFEGFFISNKGICFCLNFLLAMSTLRLLSSSFSTLMLSFHVTQLKQMGIGTIGHLNKKISLTCLWDPFPTRTWLNSLGFQQKLIKGPIKKKNVTKSVKVHNFLDDLDFFEFGNNCKL